MLLLGTRGDRGVILFYYGASFLLRLDLLSSRYAMSDDDGPFPFRLDSKCEAVATPGQRNVRVQKSIEDDWLNIVSPVYFRAPVIDRA